MKKIRFYLPAALVILGFATYFWLKPHAFYGNAVEPPLQAPNFTLTSDQGSKSLQDFHSRLVMLYFGYTYCPDVCPATMANVKRALELMGEKAQNVSMVMISVDPQRDTPQRLAAYVHNFNTAFTGLTGSKEQIDQVTNQFGIYYKERDGSSAGSYFVDHTAALLILDQAKRIVLQIPFGNSPEQIADDLSYLLR